MSAAAAMTSRPVLLTKREAAERIRIAERTLDRMTTSGRGPRITRIGRRVLIAEQDLNAWIEECAQPRRVQCG